MLHRATEISAGNSALRESDSHARGQPTPITSARQLEVRTPAPLRRQVSRQVSRRLAESRLAGTSLGRPQNRYLQVFLLVRRGPPRPALASLNPASRGAPMLVFASFRLGSVVEGMSGSLRLLLTRPRTPATPFRRGRGGRVVQWPVAASAYGCGGVCDFYQRYAAPLAAWLERQVGQREVALDMTAETAPAPQRRLGED
jgi:hypothetical protein